MHLLDPQEMSWMFWSDQTWVRQIEIRTFRRRCNWERDVGRERTTVVELNTQWWRTAAESWIFNGQNMIRVRFECVTTLRCLFRILRIHTTRVAAINTTTLLPILQRNKIKIIVLSRHKHKIRTMTTKTNTSSFLTKSSNQQAVEEKKMSEWICHEVRHHPLSF